MQQQFIAKMKEEITQSEMESLNVTKSEEERLAENIAFFERFNAAKIKPPESTKESINNLFSSVEQQIISKKGRRG